MKDTWNLPEIVVSSMEANAPARAAVQVGGGGGIRTHGRREPSVVFNTTALNHSATPPMPARILSGAGQASVGPELGRKVRADVLRGVPADQSQDFGDVSFGAGA